GLVGGDRQAHGHSGGQGAQGAVDRAGADLAGDTDRRRGGLAPWGLHRRPHGGLAGRRGDCGEPEGVHQPGAAHADAARRARDQDALRAGGWIGTHAGGGWAELPGDAREDSADRSQGAAQAAPPQPQPQVEGICGWREGRLSRSRKTSRRTNPSDAPHLSIEMWGFSLTTPSIHYRRQCAHPSAIIIPMEATSQGNPRDPREDASEASAIRTLLRRFFPFYCALAALVTFGYALYDGYQIDGDAVAYMDLGDLLRAHQWAGIVNGYWHPMYPAFLALGHM